MRYGSVCSGIEAATVAWEPLGWKPAWFAEVDPFCCAVLCHHYPDVPNLGDFTRIGAEHGPVDVVVGGTPCQDFSIAGLRAGLAGERGRLTVEFVRLLERLCPRWMVWENVPGVLSADGGRAFGAFLGLLGQLGYGFAYRVLDAQYFGVPQRRRRVFVVGHLGDWRRAAAVLFDAHSLSGHPPPRREAGKVAPTIPARRTGGGGFGTDGECDGLLQPVAYGHNNTRGPVEVSHALNAHAVPHGRQDFESETFVATFQNTGQGWWNESPVAQTVRTPDGGGSMVANVVAHALHAEGFDASAGRGTPLVQVPFDTTQVTSKANYSNPRAVDPCHPLAVRAHPPAVCYCISNQPTPTFCEDLCPSLDSKESGGGRMECVCFTERTRKDGRNLECLEDQSYALTNPGAGGRAQERNLLQGGAVRRLTPTECERLQGFPDEYTMFVVRQGRHKTSCGEVDAWGQPQAGNVVAVDPDVDRLPCCGAKVQVKLAADGPRYRALGNSMAVPVMRWIGERIELVESLWKETDR